MINREMSFENRRRCNITIKTLGSRLKLIVEKRESERQEIELSQTKIIKPQIIKEERKD